MFQPLSDHGIFRTNTPVFKHFLRGSETAASAQWLPVSAVYHDNPAANDNRAARRGGTLIYSHVREAPEPACGSVSESGEIIR